MHHDTRAAVTWKGPGEPIVLTAYGPDGEEVALPLLPKRALTLASELLTRGVQAVKADKADQWGPDPGFSFYTPPTSPQKPARARSRSRAASGAL